MSAETGPVRALRSTDEGAEAVALAAELAEGLGTVERVSPRLDAALAALADDGWSMAEIGELVGWSRQEVGRRIARHRS